MMREIEEMKKIVKEWPDDKIEDIKSDVMDLPPSARPFWADGYYEK